MPLKYPDYQKSFEFRVATDGHPVANVITLGQGRWLTVCPCCGGAHEVTSHQGDVYTPNCIVKITHPAAYRAWLDRFPEAVQHRSVLLKSVELADLDKPSVQIVPKPAKQKRTRAKPSKIKKAA